MARQPSLYMDEREIARLVLGDDIKGWEALATVWEKEGFPQIDPMTGKRFWQQFRKISLSPEWPCH